MSTPPAPAPAATAAPAPILTPRVRKVLLGILLATVVQLVALEAYLKIVRPHYYPYGQRQLLNGLVLNIPTEKTNSDGFVDVERTKEKRPGAFRVIGIGGSLGATDGPDVNFHCVAERMLKRAGFTQVEFINNCIAGYTIDSTREMFDKWTRTYAPDVVIVNFTIVQYWTNLETLRDPFVADGFTHYGAKIPYATWYYAATWRLRIFDRLLRDAANKPAANPAGGAATVSAPESPWMPPRDVAASVDERDNQGGIFGIRDYLGYTHESMFIFEKNPNPTYISNVEYHRRQLLEMRAEAEKIGARLVVAVLPAEIQTNAQLRDNMMRIFKLDPGKYDIDKPYRETIAWLEENNIPAIGTLEEFRASRRPVDIFYPRNAHFSPYGQQIVARVLARELVNRKLIPAPTFAPAALPGTVPPPAMPKSHGS